MMDWSTIEEAISRAHAVSVDSCHNITIWTGSRRPNPSGDGVLTKPRATEAQMLAAVKEWWEDSCPERQITEDNRLEFCGGRPVPIPATPPIPATISRDTLSLVRGTLFDFGVTEKYMDRAVDALLVVFGLEVSDE